MNEKHEETHEVKQGDLLEQIIAQGLEKAKAPPQEEAHEVKQGDLLEQIIAQGLEKAKAPPQEEAPEAETPPASKQGGGETTPPTEKKNRRNAVYIYLLVLFGAAFLMLLLAYFVQQRSSKDTISDLRDSMNLSREELLDQISALEKENAAYKDGFTSVYDDLTQLQKEYEERAHEANEYWDLYIMAWDELNSWNSFWILEQYYQEGDYESCATVLLIQRGDQSHYQTPKGAEGRQAEIIQAVIDKGILDDDYDLHPDDYSDLLDAHYSDVMYRLAESGMARGWVVDVSRETER